jgi:hypothetical protein
MADHHCESQHPSVFVVKGNNDTEGLNARGHPRRRPCRESVLVAIALAGAFIFVAVS